MRENNLGVRKGGVFQNWGSLCPRIVDRPIMSLAPRNSTGVATNWEKREVAKSRSRSKDGRERPWSRKERVWGYWINNQKSESKILWRFKFPRQGTVLRERGGPGEVVADERPGGGIEDYRSSQKDGKRKEGRVAHQPNFTRGI